MKYAIEMASGSMINITKFHGDQFRNSSDIMLITSTVWESAVLVLPMAGFVKYAVEMGSDGMMYIPTKFHEIPYRGSKIVGGNKYI
jgi:hypothetical protein